MVSRCRFLAAYKEGESRFLANAAPNHGHRRRADNGTAHASAGRGCAGHLSAAELTEHTLSPPEEEGRPDEGRPPLQLLPPREPAMIGLPAAALCSRRDKPRDCAAARIIRAAEAGRAPEPPPQCPPWHASMVAVSSRGCTGVGRTVQRSMWGRVWRGRPCALQREEGRRALQPSSLPLMKLVIKLAGHAASWSCS